MAGRWGYYDISREVKNLDLHVNYALKDVNSLVGEAHIVTLEKSPPASLEPFLTLCVYVCVLYLSSTWKWPSFVGQLCHVPLLSEGSQAIIRTSTMWKLQWKQTMISKCLLKTPLRS